MSRTLLALAILGSSLFWLTDQTSAALSLRLAQEPSDPAPSPPPSSDSASESAEAAGSLGHQGTAPVGSYCAPCCPAPRGFTPIKCDPRTYNCFRPMNSGLRFPYGRRFGR